MMAYIFPVSMIVFGSFLEIWYYFWRFSQEGVPTWLSVTIGVALTLLLALAVYQRKYKWSWPIIVLVSLYSIFATSAGQAFSLGEILRTEAQTEVRSEYVLDEIHDVEQQIEWIDGEVERISREIAATTNSLEDRGRWRTTLASAEERQSQLRDERSGLASRLTELRQSAQQHDSVQVRSQNIYRFYGDMMDWSPEWLQFGLQTTLSAFIAAMAPIGIITLPAGGKRRRRHRAPAGRKPTLTEDEVTRWVHRNWIGIRSGKSDKILQRDSYQTFLTNHGETFDHKRYNRMVRRALNAGVIETGGKILVTDEKNAADLILSVDN